MAEKDAELQRRFRELEVKDKIIVERDAVVRSLSDQLAQFNAIPGGYDQSNPEGKDVQTDVEVRILSLGPLPFTYLLNGEHILNHDFVYIFMLVISIYDEIRGGFIEVM